MSLSTHAAPEAGSALGVAVKAAPPVVVSGANLLGVPVADWIQYGTLIYIGVLTIRALWPIGRAAWTLIRNARTPRTME